MCNVRLGYFSVTRVYIYIALAKHMVQSEHLEDDGFLVQ